MRRVERREPHEPMDAALALQQAICVAPADEKRHRFKAGFLRRRLLDDVGCEVSRFGPTQIHASEHLRQSAASTPPAPAKMLTIALCASNSPVKVAAISSWSSAASASMTLRSTSADADGSSPEKTDQFAGVAQGAIDGGDAVASRLLVGEFLHHALRRLGIVPEPLGTGALLELGYSADFACVVKDAP